MTGKANNAVRKLNKTRTSESNVFRTFLIEHQMHFGFYSVVPLIRKPTFMLLFASAFVCSLLTQAFLSHIKRSKKAWLRFLLQEGTSEGLWKGQCLCSSSLWIGSSCSFSILYHFIKGLLFLLHFCLIISALWIHFPPTPGRFKGSFCSYICEYHSRSKSMDSSVDMKIQ